MHQCFSPPRAKPPARRSATIYAGGQNSTATVAAMDVKVVSAELAELMARNEWTVPYLDEHNQPVEEMVREIIAEALEQVMADEEERE